MSIVFQKPKFLTDAPTHYCPGCSHGIVHRLVAEALEAVGAEGHVVVIALPPAPAEPYTILIAAISDSA